MFAIRNIRTSYVQGIAGTNQMDVGGRRSGAMIDDDDRCARRTFFFCRTRSRVSHNRFLSGNFDAHRTRKACSFDILKFSYTVRPNSELQLDLNRTRSLHVARRHHVVTPFDCSALPVTRLHTINKFRCQFVALSQ